MTLMNDSDILWRSTVSPLDGDPLISPFYQDQLQPCSYDVTLGDTVKGFIPSSLDDNVPINHIDTDPYEKFTSCKEFVEEEKGYIIEPGEFVLGYTDEIVYLPSNIAARFEGKSSLGRIGLMTHITAGFIDPGFHGQITLEIYNVNRRPIVLRPGMRIGQLCFFKLDEPCARPYGSKQLKSHYQGQTGVTESSIYA